MKQGADADDTVDSMQQEDTQKEKYSKQNKLPKSSQTKEIKAKSYQ